MEVCLFFSLTGCSRTVSHKGGVWWRGGRRRLGSSPLPARLSQTHGWPAGRSVRAFLRRRRTPTSQPKRESSLKLSGPFWLLCPGSVDIAHPGFDVPWPHSRVLPSCVVSRGGRGPIALAPSLPRLLGYSSTSTGGHCTHLSVPRGQWLVLF